MPSIAAQNIVSTDLEHIAHVQEYYAKYSLW